MADLLRQAQENEAASRRQPDAAERKGAEPRAGPPDKERRQEDEQQ